MGRKLSLFERAGVFVITFVVVVYIMSFFRGWQYNMQYYFLQAEKWPELIFILAFVSALSMILTKLLQWEFRIKSGRK